MSDDVTLPSGQPVVGPATFQPPPRRSDSDEQRMQKQFFEQIRKSALSGMSAEHVDQLKRLGEKFHQSFDVDAQRSRHTSANEIFLEESLAYVVESVKSGLHPKFLSDDECHLLEAGYGPTWWEEFGYAAAEVGRE